MNKYDNVKPVVKWIGGKKRLLKYILPLLPDNITSYCEPFIGGGAVLFALCPEKAYINDINPELITVYNVVKNDVESLIKELSTYKSSKDFYYNMRQLDRDANTYNSLTDVQKAARVIYLNKTCFNGLYRVNSKGYFNAAFGGYIDIDVVNEKVLRAVSNYLNDATTYISVGDYKKVLDNISTDTFVYLDPPYDASYTGYSKEGFSQLEQLKLKEYCDKLTANGIKFMMSNSTTDFILEQYANYNITTVPLKSTLSPDSARRVLVNEVIIRNYK